MCLKVSGDDVLLTAKRDLVCYKFIESDVETPNNYTTPYRYLPIEIGETYDSVLDELNVVGLNVDGFYIINLGLHSLTNKADCTKFAKHFTNQRNNQCVVKCIIPKGSLYYKGAFEGYNGFVSNRITYVKII